MSKDQKFNPDLELTNNPDKLAEHTPGPWAAFGIDVRSAAIVLEGRTIAKTTDHAAGSKELVESYANARLIASAPDLLSIAKLAYRASQIDVNDLVGRVQLVALMGAIGGMAKVAIAKVEDRE